MTGRGREPLKRTSLQEGGRLSVPGLMCLTLTLLPPQWDLVCSHRALRQLGQSLYMAGVLIGAMVFGYLADRSVLGRVKRPGKDWKFLHCDQGA